MQTMTAAQMNWNLTHGFAWWEKNTDEMPNDDWRGPICTKDGLWLFNSGPKQCYEQWP